MTAPDKSSGAPGSTAQSGVAPAPDQATATAGAAAAPSSKVSQIVADLENIGEVSIHDIEALAGALWKLIGDFGVSAEIEKAKGHVLEAVAWVKQHLGMA